MHRISILRFPSGRFGYVGSVPADLAIVCTEGYEDRAYDIAAQVGMGLAKQIATREGWEIKTRTFETEDAARTFATDKGYKILNAQPAFA